MAKKKQSEPAPAPAAAAGAAVARALAQDLAAGVEAVREAAGAAVTLPPSKLGELVDAIRGPLAAQRESEAERFVQLRAKALRVELDVLHERSEGLAATPDTPLPDAPAVEGHRVVAGTVRAGADGTPLPAVALVMHSSGGARCAAALTDELGRFRLEGRTEEVQGATVKVLDAAGAEVTSCAVPHEETGELHLEVDARKLPESYGLAKIARELRDHAQEGARERIAEVEAELALLPPADPPKG